MSASGAAGAGTACSTPVTSKVNLISGGGAFKPAPFTALRVQRFPYGFDTGTVLPVRYTAQVDGYLPADVPHVVEGLAVPGVPGDVYAGFYILFGQQIP
jgi:hypothetical protein